MDKIKTFEHFEFLLKKYLESFKLFIIKDINVCELVNNSKNDTEDYYTSKRKKLLKKINSNTVITRFILTDNKINVNSEDINIIKKFIKNRFEQINNTKNWIDEIKNNTSDDDLRLINKELTKQFFELQKFCSSQLNDFKNSFKLAYYNHKLNVFKLQKKKQLQPVKKDYNTQYLDIFAPYGFELFEYLNTHFTESRKQIKYTEIMLIMKKEYIHCSALRYRLFVNDNYIKLSRLKNNSLNDDNITIQLTDLINKFNNS